MYLKFLLLAFSYLFAQNDMFSQVTLEKELIDRATYLGNAQYTINNTKDFQKTMEIYLLYNIYKNKPDLSIETSTKQLNEVRNNYKMIFEKTKTINPTKSDEYTLFMKALKTVPLIAEYINITDFGLSLSGYLYKDISDTWNDAVGLSIQTHEYNLYNFSDVFLNTSLENSYDLAQTNVKFRSSFNLNFSTFFGAKIIEDDANKIIRNNPSYGSNATVQSIEKKIDGNGNLILSKQEELDALLIDQFGQINEAISSQSGRVKTIADQQNDINKYIKNEEQRRKNEVEIQSQVIYYQSKIDAANSGIYILSIIAKLAGNEKLANEINVIGSSSIQIATSINKYSETISKIGKLDFGNALSSIALSGNILSAVMNIASLFGSSASSSPFQVTYDQIKIMHEELHQFRIEVRDYFQAIDNRLVDIQKDIDYNFNIIANSLVNIETQVFEVKNALYKLTTRLNSFEKRSYSYISDLYKQNFILAFNGGLEYQQRYGEILPDKDFRDYEQIFYSWAVDFSKGNILAGDPTMDVSDYSLLNNLDDYPTETRLNYILRFLDINFKENIKQPLSSKRIPNSTYWYISSAAYLQLLRENTTKTKKLLSTKKGRQRLIDIYNTGKTIQENLKNIYLTVDIDGHISPNTSLFDSLFSFYKSKLEVVNLERKKSEEEFISDIWVKRYPEWKPILTFESIAETQNQKVSFNNFDSSIDYKLKLASIYGFGKPTLSFNSIVMSNTNSKINKIPVDCRPYPMITSYPEYLVIASTNCLREKGQDAVYCEETITSGILDGSFTFRLDTIKVKTYSFNTHIEDKKYRLVRNCPCLFDQNKNCGKSSDDYNISAQWQKNIQDKSMDVFKLESSRREIEIATQKFTYYIIDSLSLQMSQYINLKSNQSGTELSIALEKLDGANKLIKALIYLALPHSLETDDYLRSSIFGNLKLPDSHVFLSDYFLLKSYDRNKKFEEYDNNLFELKEYLKQLLIKISTGNIKEYNSMVKENIDQIEIILHNIN